MTGSDNLRAGSSEDPRVQAAVAQLRDLLVPTETLEAWAIQHRLFALNQRRTIVGATSGRLVVMYRGLVGGFRLHDVRWQDLKDAKLRVGIFGADLTVVALTSSDLAVAGQANLTLTIEGLRKDQAQNIYRICQTHEQAWREKRRIRELEELRAKSGGVQIGSTAGIAASVSSSSENDDPVVRLQRAKEMLQKGLISDSEYEAIKARVVSGV